MAIKYRSIHAVSLSRILWSFAYSINTLLHCGTCQPFMFGPCPVQLGFLSNSSKHWDIKRHGQVERRQESTVGPAEDKWDEGCRLMEAAPARDKEACQKNHERDWLVPKVLCGMQGLAVAFVWQSLPSLPSLECSWIGVTTVDIGQPLHHGLSEKEVTCPLPPPSRGRKV